MNIEGLTPFESERSEGLLFLIMLCLLFMNVPSVHAVVENLQYSYDDGQQIREVTYEDGTTIDYSYDTSGNRLSKDTSTSTHSNNAPSAPSTPDPDDTEIDVELPVTLSWTASTDSDAGDVVTYDIYFGTATSPPLIVSGHEATTYPVDLKPNILYYWKIVARDNHNATTSGPEWSFTIQNVPSVPLIADFSVFPNNVIGPVTVYFTNTSTGYGPLTYEWDFDTTVSSIDSTLQNPPHEYEPGTYTVKLTVYDSYGRSISEEKTNYIVMLLDSDGDGIVDANDNCPDIANPDQTDTDGDYNPGNPQPINGGDACDTDIDGDYVTNDIDNCMYAYNSQLDLDDDGIGDACDFDMDGDGIFNDEDNCQFDQNGPGYGTCVRGDNNGDSCTDDVECPGTDNPYCSMDQEDSDDDGFGDACTENNPIYTCVDSSETFLAALINAQSNDKHDVIKLVRDVVYSVADNNDAMFKYSTTKKYSLVIRGGYDEGCNNRTGDAATTVIDGWTSQKTRTNQVLSLTDIYAFYIKYDEWLMIRKSLEVDGVTAQNGKTGIYVQAYSGDITVKNSIAQDNINASNAGAGIYADAYEGIILEGNLSRNNVANRGAGIYMYSYYGTGNLILANNVITGNEAKTASYNSGAGVFIDLPGEGEDSKVLITNNTITENRAPNSYAANGTGMHIWLRKMSSTAEMNNNIIWNNLAPCNNCKDLYIQGPGAIYAFNNNIENIDGSYTEESGNNYTDPPLFIAAGFWDDNGTPPPDTSDDFWVSGDYRLQPDAPTIDSGKTLLSYLPDYDFEGNPRIINYDVDIGAYEASGITVTPQFNDFGYVTVDSPSYKTFSVINNGLTDITVSSITTPPAPFSITNDLCTGQTINHVQGSNCTIEVEFQPTSNILYSGNFDILSDDAVNSTLTVYLRGEGNLAPIADVVSPTPTYEGVQVCFDGSASSDPDGTIDLYEWDIDDDGTYEYSPSSSTQCHTYQDDDEYTVRLRVTDNRGATHDDTTTATISDTSPTANFTGSPTNDRYPFTVDFINNSTGYDQPLTYEWDFDNNGTIDSPATSPSHEYTSPGIYTVKLTATDSDTSTNTLTRTNHITVYVDLTVNKAGSGSGTVTSTPPGIDCGTDCTESYTNSSTNVTLTAAPDNGDSTFSGWSGEGCNGTGNCIVTMDANRTVTATFNTCGTNPVRITRTPSIPYFTLQDAYNAAITGDIIQSRDSVFVENLIYDNTAFITVEGGYDCDYSYITGVTSVQGSMTIQDGTVEIYDYLIE